MIDKQTRFYALMRGGLFGSRHIRSYLLFSRFLLWKLCISSHANIPISDIFLPEKKNNNLVKFVLPPLQRQAAHDIL